MLLIYTPKVSARARYIFDLFLGELLHISYSLTSGRDEFLAYEGPKLNYSAAPFGEELFLEAANLLFERGVDSQKISYNFSDGDHILFPTYNRNSVLRYDPFAAGFYMVTRYEEYLPYMKDEYGRFSARESLAFQKGFLQRPVVNIWADTIGRILNHRYPGLHTHSRRFRFISTIDVDAAYAYKQKGIFRTAGAYADALLKRNFADMANRTRTLLGLRADPFDTFAYHKKLQQQYRFDLIYFILFGDYGLNDKNISPMNRSFQTLVKSLADYADIGIHPSFASNKDVRKLKTETARLSSVLHREITKSRQHFLIVNLPMTYRNLINLDITDDYSMGFAAQPGFRAGICDSFYFYDLELEVKTALRVHPFAMMDGTLRDYLNIQPDKAVTYIGNLIREVKEVNGAFISIWHNESLGDTGRWKGWRAVYEEMVHCATQ